MRLHLDDVVADLGLDDLRTSADFKAESGSFDFGVEQVTSGEPTQFTAGFGAVLPGQRAKVRAAGKACQRALSAFGSEGEDLACPHLFDCVGDGG